MKNSIKFKLITASFTATLIIGLCACSSTSAPTTAETAENTTEINTENITETTEVEIESKLQESDLREQQILDCLNNAEEYEMPDEYPDLKKICEIHLYVDESHTKIIPDGEEIVLEGYEGTDGYLYDISGEAKTLVSPELDELIDQYIAENAASASEIDPEESLNSVSDELRRFSKRI